MDEMNRNNKCYEANDETAINMSSLENLTGRKDNLREKIVNEWTHQGKKIFIQQIYQFLILHNFRI